MNPLAKLSRRTAFVALAAALLWTTAAAQAAPDQQFPDIVSVEVRSAGNGIFDFDVKVSSPYDTPQRYADGFRVTTNTGEVLGERKLWHDHQGEQPFVRDLYGVKIPPGVKIVTVQGRDQKSGYGGGLVKVKLPGR